jgi:DNA-directed RNA polymerase specialized sigma24 family protein
MSELTFAQITAAQAYDQDAVTAVLAEMDSRIVSLAAKSAGSLATNPARYADYAEEFRQDAMVALLEYMPRWSGDSVDAFREYLYGAMAGELRAKVGAERNSGVDRDAFSTFKAMVAEADGDLHEAEKLSQTKPPKGKRLSKDRALAARLAWQGPVSIDKTSDDDDETSILHTLAVTDETPDVRPKVGHGAALEALAVLHRYTTAREVLRKLPATAEDVDTIEDAIAVPRDADVRRYVLGAVAILRSYVSTVADGELANDLRDVSDDRRDERAAKIGNVHTALGKLSPGQRGALHFTFGIDGAQEFGDGDGSDVAGLAEAMGTTEGSAKKTRSVAKVSFVKHYIPLVATSEDDAQAWHAAAAEARKNAGRK